MDRTLIKVLQLIAKKEGCVTTADIRAIAGSETQRIINRLNRDKVAILGECSDNGDAQIILCMDREAKRLLRREGINY